MELDSQKVNESLQKKVQDFASGPLEEAYKLRKSRNVLEKLSKYMQILLRRLELVIRGEGMKVLLMKASLVIFCINWNRILSDQEY